MKRRVCQGEGVMFETRLRVHLSRCERDTSQHYLGPVNEEICNSCPQRIPVEDVDELANSMAAEIFDVEVNENSAEILANLDVYYCPDCSH